MQYQEIIQRIKALSNPEAVSNMERFGISASNTYGVSIPNLRAIAKDADKNHSLAQQLWASGIHEARILASMIDEATKVTPEQMEGWVKDFDSWDVCDGCCNNLFYKTSFAYQKALEWSSRSEEFVKRAGFVLMACLAVHDKRAADERFLGFLSLIIRGSVDDRNFVRKAVNWALRQIGKRNLNLNQAAIETARTIQGIDSKSAKWVASDALRELASGKIQLRLQRQEEP
ncbi:MAG: DNA alkylation repair protein [Chloroflexi bacterium]|nr:DNA alkylation repair protein [Chloroflexota bacterium]